MRTDPETRQKVITTEEGARKIDARREEIRWKKRWFGLLESYGITKRDFLSEKGRLAKKFQTEPADSDLVWALFNTLLLRHARISDFHTLQTIYHNMAAFVEEEGKDCFHLFQQASRMELLHHRQSGCTKVEITNCNDNDVCPSCRNLEGQIFDINDALELMPLPNKDCTTDLEARSRGFCRCSYIGLL